MKKRQKVADNKFKFLILPICFIVVGLALLWQCEAILNDEASKINWPSTMGVIEKVDTYKYFKGKTSIEYFGISATYHYFVNNMPFKSSNISLLGNYESTQLEEISRLKKQYRIGEKVKVFYNPNKPTESVLIHKESIYSHRPFTELLFTGIVLILLGLLIVFSNIYSKVKKRGSTS